VPSAEETALPTIASRLAFSVARCAARTGRPLRAAGRNASSRPVFGSPADLVDQHFRTRSDLAHVNASSMGEALGLLDGRPATILETGASTGRGTESSLLFDDYVTAFGGTFATVDIRLGPLRRLRPLLGPRSSVTCDDSVRFLERWVREHPGATVDLAYLDSFDVDFADPLPAALHGLRELWAIRPALGGGSLLLVDDTPATLDDVPPPGRPGAAAFHARHGLVPGKGMLVDVCLASAPGVEKLRHGYQALYRFD
jgi:hypothetical protein